MNFRFYYYLWLLLLPVIISGCSKEEEIPEFHYKTIVTLTNDLKILQVDFYSSDTLSYKKTFSYKVDEVEELEINNKGILRRKTIFYLDSLGLASHCIDTIFNNSSSTTMIFNYQYDSAGYLKETEFENYSPGYSLLMTYKIEGGNVVELTFGGSCSEYYNYSYQINKLDLISFLGDFAGKRNSNLRKSYYSGCHSAPSTSPPSSTYEYKLNSNDFVTQRIEYYTPGHHSDTEVTIEKRITDFEYIFK